MKNFTNILAVFLLLPATAGGRVFAATNFVAKSGSDSNPGTEAQPWLTIQKAANTLAPGDMVYIKAGTYNEKVTPQNSGSAGNYITYAGYPGDTVTIDGQGSLPTGSRWLGVFDVSQKSYIKATGLRAVNSRFAGFFAQQSDHIIFEKCFTSNTWSSGIAAWNNCSHITISSNEVVKACQGDNGSGDLQECITVSGGHNFEIKFNHVHDRVFAKDTNGGEGIDAKDASSSGTIHHNVVHDLGLELGIYVDAYNSTEENIEVYDNIVYNAYDGITLATEKSGGLLRNVKVYNNILYNNLFDGIIIADNDQDGPKQNITIINNTIYSNGYNTLGWGGGITVSSKNINNKDLVIRNNICSHNGEWQIMRASSTGLTVDYNLIDGFRGYSSGSEVEVKGEHAVEGDPMFGNPGSHNFHLMPGSPAIDAGTNADWTASAKDFEGNVRIIGGAVDIGAYEFVQDYTNPPAIPANLAASDGTVFGAVNVTWDAAARATHYHVFRNATNDLSGATNPFGNVGEGTLVDNTIVGGCGYWYWVRAVNNAGTSDFSNADSGYALIGIQVTSPEWKLKNKRKAVLKGKPISPLLSQYLTNGYGIGIWDSAAMKNIDGPRALTTKNNKVWKFKNPSDKSAVIKYKEKFKAKKNKYVTKLKYILRGQQIPVSNTVYIAPLSLGEARRENR